MKDCIRDFVESWKPYDGARSTIIPTWSARFRDAGYCSVPLTDHNVIHHWQDVHQWCKHQFGETHYTWTGSIFWFETEEAAAWFALRWQ